MKSLIFLLQWAAVVVAAISLTHGDSCLQVATTEVTKKIKFLEDGERPPPSSDGYLVPHHIQKSLSSGHRNTLHASCTPRAVCAKPPFGRLGNRLYVLGALLQVAAQKNLCFVSTSRIANDMVDSVLHLPEIIDVATGRSAPNPRAISCAYTCHSMSGCGRSLPNHHLIIRGDIQRIIHANKHTLKCNSRGSDHPALGSEGIVMHMRGGDIMREGGRWAKSGFYPQPPCTFYTHLASHGNNGKAFKHVLIVTEPDHRNPCVQYMEKSRRAAVEVQSRSVAEDACRLVQAQNLAISVGTWGPALASLSSRLRNLYVPFGTDGGTAYAGKFDGLDSVWYREVVVEEGLAEVRQHVYTFPGFDTTWDSWDDRVSKMVNYGESKIVSRLIAEKAGSRGY